MPSATTVTIDGFESSSLRTVGAIVRHYSPIIATESLLLIDFEPLATTVLAVELVVSLQTTVSYRSDLG